MTEFPGRCPWADELKPFGLDKVAEGAEAVRFLKKKELSVASVASREPGNPGFLQQEGAEGAEACRFRKTREPSVASVASCEPET